jgi:hypothetical protein
MHEVTVIVVVLASAGILWVGYAMLFGRRTRARPVRSTERFRVARTASGGQPERSLRDDLVAK